MLFSFKVIFVRNKQVGSLYKMLNVNVRFFFIQVSNLFIIIRFISLFNEFNEIFYDWITDSFNRGLPTVSLIS